MTVIDPARGLLPHARFVASPNCNARPEGVVIDLLVIHGISLPPGKFSGDAIEALFTNSLDVDADPGFAGLRGLEVSAHLLIRRDGKVIQFVPFGERAWHAGVSRFQGRDGCNDFSIGIELEGTDEIPYTKAQYRRLIVVARALMKAYPGITPERVVGHVDIAPGRKTDPGPVFDWAQLRAGLKRKGR
ncbi:MAG: 1,6-anhydro-N-acetylmuramyl-L-alanine amidase AmpD [Gammaproteobacteria bacterium]|nr:1,6-anhydro-N-acetylmuramyl-L-alanine amidase AmpD [Gammaproteobacteria bacterium]MCP5137688.1 1,6-anhydro-N-acetylmuramyl-L-alanine amidase AmpD [Gammaproteobacteria bacterium]